MFGLAGGLLSTMLAFSLLLVGFDTLAAPQARKSDTKAANTGAPKAPKAAKATTATPKATKAPKAAPKAAKVPSSKGKTASPKAASQPRVDSQKALPSGRAKALFREANQAYNEGNYGTARKLFETLASQPDWRHFFVYYNLGNTYFRLQQYGKALANYRKAQRMKPNDPNLLHNIQLLYQRINKDEQTIPQLRIKFLFWYYLLSLKQLFLVVLLATYLGLLLWGVHIRRTSTQQNTGLRWYVAAAMTVVLVLWISLGIKVYREELRQVGVITAERITARSGYGRQFEPLFRLSQADEVLIKERVDVTNKEGQVEKWVRVEIFLYDKERKQRTKQIGWIPYRTVEAI